MNNLNKLENIIIKYNVDIQNVDCLIKFLEKKYNSLKKIEIYVNDFELFYNHNSLTLDKVMIRGTKNLELFFKIFSQIKYLQISLA